MLSRIARQFGNLNNTRISSAFITVFQQRNSSTLESNIVRSKYPDVTIPNVLVDEYIFKGLDKWPNKIAVECAATGRTYTYVEIYKKSRALANFLHKYPLLKQGDTLAIILPNVPEYPIVVLGAAQAGIKITTVNPVYTSDEIARQLQDSGAKVVFTLNELWSKVDQAIRSLPSLKFSVVVIDHEQNQAAPGAIKFKDVIKGDHNLSFKISRSLEDVLVLPYSSGTTGLPKGVELTNRNITANLVQMGVPELSYMFTEDDVIPAILPMFHIYGMTTVMLSLISRGCKLVTMHTFEPQLFIDVLQKHNPTMTFVVPPLVLFMINHPGVKPEYITRMKTIFSGAAPLGATDIERLQEKSKSDIKVLQGYGLTETSPVVFSQTAAVPNGIKLGGSGLCARNTECKIVSLEDETKTLGPNQSGELHVRGPQVMKGYYNNPQATNEVLDTNGWFKTGDIAHYDEDEHFFITDRLKELIKVKGFQVAPAELEELLRDHPGVEDAAVTGVPHAAFGEAPRAFIIPKKGVTINPKIIHEYIEPKVAKHKQLVGGVVIVESIPKTASGKILRRQLREL